MADDQIRVLIIDDHRELARGVEATLDEDAEMIVVDKLDRLPDPDRPGLRFDVCVLDLMGHATAEELVRFLRRAPSVVYSIESRWQQRVAAWVCGARSVLGKDVSGRTLVDAVRDVVRRPHVLSPQLAAALVRAVDEHAVVVPDEVRRLLEECAQWAPQFEAVLAEVDVTVERWIAELAALRRELARVGLAHLEILGDHATPAGSSDVAVPVPDFEQLTDRQQDCVSRRAAGATVREIARDTGIEQSTVQTHLKSALARFGIAKTDIETQILFSLHVTGHYRPAHQLRARLSELQRTHPVDTTPKRRLEL